MRKQTGALKSEATITLKEDDSSDPDSFARALKPVLMEAIQDVLDELETVYDNISKTAKDHIHPECACIRYLIRPKLMGAIARLF